MRKATFEKTILKVIGIIGTGQMGCGICELLARNSIPVVLMGRSENSISDCIQRISSSLNKDINTKRITDTEKKEIMDKISTTTKIDSLKKVDIVIECVIESLKTKQEIFKMCDEHLPKNTIFATNTSSMSITEIASFTSRPEKVIGLHFMNPPTVMRLVEIIRGLHTSQEIFEICKKFVENLEKVPCASLDRPGFIVNRLLIVMINEAFFSLMEGIASKEDIDRAMMLGASHRMGPLKLADFIGLDVCLSTIENMHKELGDDKYRPCPLLRQYVRAGWYGKKTKKGVYEY